MHKNCSAIIGIIIIGINFVEWKYYVCVYLWLCGWRYIIIFYNGAGNNNNILW